MEYIALLKEKLSSQSKLLGLSPQLDDNEIMIAISYKSHCSKIELTGRQ